MWRENVRLQLNVDASIFNKEKQHLHHNDSLWMTVADDDIQYVLSHDHSARLNSTRLYGQLSWVELSRVGRYDHGLNW